MLDYYKEQFCDFGFCMLLCVSLCCHSRTRAHVFVFQRLFSIELFHHMTKGLNFFLLYGRSLINKVVCIYILIPVLACLYKWLFTATWEREERPQIVQHFSWLASISQFFHQKLCACLNWNFTTCCLDICSTHLFNSSCIRFAKLCLTFSIHIIHIAKIYTYNIILD